MLSSVLYERRFGPYFCGPVVAGLDDEGVPFLSGMDSLGAAETAKDFMVQGTSPESLYGMCEVGKKSAPPSLLFLLLCINLCFSLCMHLLTSMFFCQPVKVH